MKRILFPGNMRQACEAWYSVTIQGDGGFIAKAQIVVVQTDKINPGAMGTSLWNTNAGRDNVLNRILETELQGVRTEFASLVSALDLGGDLRAIELPIHLDVDDYIARGNRYNVQQAPAQDWIGTLENAVGMGNKIYSFWSGDVVGGCARFYTDFEEQRSVEPSIVRDWMSALSCPF